MVEGSRERCTHSSKWPVLTTEISDVLTEEFSSCPTFSRTNCVLSGSLSRRQTSLHLWERRKASMPLVPWSVAPNRWAWPRSEWMT